MRSVVRNAFASTAFMAAALAAQAQTVKIGYIDPFSGAFVIVCVNSESLARLSAPMSVAGR